MRVTRTLVAIIGFVCVSIATPVMATPQHHNNQHHARQETHLHHHQAASRKRTARTYAYQPPTAGSGSSLVAEARRYIGTNPTGRRSLWCGAFVDFVLRKTGHPGGGNLAKSYLRYGHRVSGPRVGAIAVMERPGKDASGNPGGHVGIVSRIDANGNPVLISGDHGGTTAESVYTRGRIIAYVMP